jgi:hypothetical protein
MVSVCLRRMRMAMAMKAALSAEVSGGHRLFRLRSWCFGVLEAEAETEAEYQYPGAECRYRLVFVVVVEMRLCCWSNPLFFPQFLASL